MNKSRSSEGELTFRYKITLYVENNAQFQM